jgi:hypothetical protein
MTAVKFWLPKGLDLAPAMNRASLGESVVYAEWVVSEAVRWARINRVADGEYVPLARAHLLTGVPEYLLSRIKAVLVPAVLECDDRYWFHSSGPAAAGKCLGYRLAKWCRDTPVRPVIRESSELARKLEVAANVQRQRTKARLDELSPVHRTLWRHMQDTWLHPQAETETNERDEPYPVVDYLVGTKPRWYEVCDQGRVHHPVTNCPRTLRPHLRLRSGAKPVALVDVATSQPLIMGLTAGGGRRASPRGDETTEKARGEERRAKGRRSY